MGIYVDDSVVERFMQSIELLTAQIKELTKEVSEIAAGIPELEKSVDYLKGAIDDLTSDTRSDLPKQTDGTNDTDNQTQGE